MGDKAIEANGEGAPSLKSIIRKEQARIKLTTSERKTLAEFRRRNPAWSEVYQSRLTAESVKVTATPDSKEELQIRQAPSRLAFGLVQHED
jgi:hypothetical protein